MIGVSVKPLNFCLLDFFSQVLIFSLKEEQSLHVEPVLVEPLPLATLLPILIQLGVVCANATVSVHVGKSKYHTSLRYCESKWFNQIPS